MRRIVLAVIVVCLLGITLAAQTVAPLALLQLVQTVSQRLDALQRRADRSAFGTQVFAYAWIDVVTEPQPGTVRVQGWGFGCGYDDSRIVLVVDGIETANGVFRLPRADVNAAFAGTCNVQGNTGVEGLIDMAVFEPGLLSGDHRHTFTIRVYPPAWPTVIPFASADSPVYSFTTY